jgi:hypothetical protein
MSPLSVPLNIRSLLLLIVLSILYLLGVMTPLVSFCLRPVWVASGDVSFPELRFASIDG